MSCPNATELWWCLYKITEIALPLWNLTLQPQSNLYNISIYLILLISLISVQRDIEITTRIWLDCFNIQLALLEDWRNPRGQIALETLMKKACLVCEAVTYEKLGIQRDDLQMDIASIGGDSYFDGGCTVAFATVSPNQVIKQKDSVRVKNSKRNKLTAEETWNEKTYLEKHYTPDVCFRSWSQSSLLSCITGAVKSYKPDKSDIQVVWNQSLIGLQDMEKTYAVIMSPKEAMILEIEVDKRDTVNTYVRHYPLISKGDLDSELVEKFFYDLVLAVWDSRYSEHSWIWHNVPYWTTVIFSQEQL